MNTEISVLVPTHNPQPALLAELWNGLARQTLAAEMWELLLVDNGSEPALQPDFEVLSSVGVSCRIVRESRLGLSLARLAGFREAAGNLIVMLDDDNVPAPDYLELAHDFARRHPQVGTFGGKSLPIYATPTPAWFQDTGISLGCRDLGEREIVVPAPANGRLEEYPSASPIGAGMVLRSQVATQYIQETSSRDPQRAITDRSGHTLSSGGDCDIVMVALKNGWDTAYVPGLKLVHHISAPRLTLEYLQRMAHDSNRSWVNVLDMHGMRPWPSIPPWSLPIREARTWLRQKPWQGDLQSIRWHAAKGRLRGQADLQPS